MRRDGRGGMTLVLVLVSSQPLLSPDMVVLKNL